VKYQFTGSASYDLPIGKGRVLNLNAAGDAILGGWTINGIVYLSTGVPIASPAVGTYPGAPQGLSFFNQRPNLTCDPSKGAPHTAATWFNPNCFAYPASPYVAGNAPAYLANVRTMGANDVDLSLYKNFSLGEKKDIRIEISSYNIANRAQFGMPNTPSIFAVNTEAGQAAAFGQISATVNTPRQFQFGSRFTF